LAANPLANEGHLQLRAGVMVSGRWFSENDLQSMLADLADSYRPTQLERIWPLSIIGFAVVLILRSFNFFTKEN
jgi:hypothetical protein